MNAITLDLDGACNFLNITRELATRLADEGVLPGAKIGKAWVFLESDLVDYLRAEVGRQQRQRQLDARVAPASPRPHSGRKPLPVLADPAAYAHKL